MVILYIFRPTQRREILKNAVPAQGNNMFLLAHRNIAIKAYLHVI